MSRHAEPDRSPNTTTSDDNDPQIQALTRIVDKATEDYTRQLVLANEMLRDAGKSFDQTLITLSAGAVALSVTYLRPQGPIPTFLLAAWISFGVALSLALISFKLVQVPLAKTVHRWSLAITRSERGLSAAVLGNDEEARAAFAASVDENMLDQSAQKWRTVVAVTNMVAVVMFVLGVVLLLTFTSQARRNERGFTMKWEMTRE